MYHTESKHCSTTNVLFTYRKSFVGLRDQLVSIVWFQFHSIGKKWTGNGDWKWGPLLTNKILVEAQEYA